MRVLAGNPSEWITYKEADVYSFTAEGHLFLWKTDPTAAKGSSLEKRIALFPRGGWYGLDWEDKGGGAIGAEISERQIGFRPG